MNQNKKQIISKYQRVIINDMYVILSFESHNPRSVFIQYKRIMYKKY